MKAIIELKNAEELNESIQKARRLSVELQEVLQQIEEFKLDLDVDY